VIHRYRRLWLLAGIVAGLVAAPASALAAVAPEVTLTVHFADAVTLLAIDRADIHVTAHQDGAVIGEFDGETDAAGIAVLSDLPRETGEGGPVTLDIVAHKATSFTDAESGCVANDTWDAARLGVPVDDIALSVDFTVDEQQSVSSIECPPDQPAPTGEVSGAVGTPGRTLPPTDVASSAPSGGAGTIMVAVGLVGLSAGMLMVLPRRRPATRRVRR
jgi:hypothetical protein